MSSKDMSAFDGIKGPVQSYVDIWTPMFKQASESGLVPDFLLHWGHGAAMASVLLSMGVIGAYSEWKPFFYYYFIYSHNAIIHTSLTPCDSSQWVGRLDWATARR